MKEELVTVKMLTPPVCLWHMISNSTWCKLSLEKQTILNEAAKIIYETGYNPMAMPSHKFVKIT